MDVFFKERKKRKQIIKKQEQDQKQQNQNQQQQDFLSTDLNKNLQKLQNIYQNCMDVVFRPFQIGGKTKAALIYIDGLADIEEIDAGVLTPLMKENNAKENTDQFIHVNHILEQKLTVSKVKRVQTITEYIEQISGGNPVLLIDQQSEGFALGLAHWEKRSIEEPVGESVIRGPREGFTDNVLVSEGTAKSVLELVPSIEQSSSEVLRELSESQLLLRVTVKDVLQMLSGDAGAAALPMVKIKPPEEGKKELQPIAFIQRTAIFKKDKMIGDIDDQLTRGVLWLRNEIKEANITIKPKGEKGNITATLIRAHTELIPKYEKGKWKMIVKATAEDDIILNGTKLDLLNPKYTKMIEKELAKETNKRIRNTLKKVQKEMKADIFGFAEVFHRKYPREWNRVKDRWEEIFPDVEVVVKTKAYVRRPGIDTAPQGLPEQEVKK